MIHNESFTHLINSLVYTFDTTVFITSLNFYSGKRKLIIWRDFVNQLIEKHTDKEY